MSEKEDIVSKLRRFSAWGWEDLLTRAAAEIERLLAELDAVNTRFHELTTPTGREIELQSEVRRLHNALKNAEGRSIDNKSRLRDANAEIEQLQRRLEACRRYFEHCERVSLSAQHATCDSGEMQVRMALKREAIEAARAAEGGE